MKCFIDSSSGWHGGLRRRSVAAGLLGLLVWIPLRAGIFVTVSLFSQKKCEKWLLASCLPIRPSVRMEQLGSHWTDFHEIWYPNIFRKFVEKIRVLLKYDKNNGCFTWRPVYFLIVSRSTLLRMRNVSDKNCRENQNTHFICSDMFSKIVSFMS